MCLFFVFFFFLKISLALTDGDRVKGDSGRTQHTPNSPSACPQGHSSCSVFFSAPRMQLSACTAWNKTTALSPHGTNIIQRPVRAAMKTRKEDGVLWLKGKMAIISCGFGTATVPPPWQEVWIKISADTAALQDELVCFKTLNRQRLKTVSFICISRRSTEINSVWLFPQPAGFAWIRVTKCFGGVWAKRWKRGRLETLWDSDSSGQREAHGHMWKISAQSSIDGGTPDLSFKAAEQWESSRASRHVASLQPSPNTEASEGLVFIQTCTPQRGRPRVWLVGTSSTHTPGCAGMKAVGISRRSPDIFSSSDFLLTAGGRYGKNFLSSGNIDALFMPILPSLRSILTGRQEFVIVLMDLLLPHPLLRIGNYENSSLEQHILMADR